MGSRNGRKGGKGGKVGCLPSRVWAEPRLGGGDNARAQVVDRQRATGTSVRFFLSGGVAPVGGGRGGRGVRRNAGAPSDC